MESVAKEVDELARYDEYLTQETKWELARNRSSLITEAVIRGYSPHRKVGATGTIWVSSKEYAFADYWKSYIEYSTGDYVRTEDQTIYKALQDNQDVQPPNATYWEQVSAVHRYVIGIPKYTVFQTENEIAFTSVASTELLTSENYAEVDVVQGEPKTYRITAEGDLYEKITINNDSLDDTYYEVFVNGDKYTEVNDIRTADATDKVFQIKNKLDFSGVILIFGNDITGRKLVNGDEITFKCIETIGQLGEVLSQGDINNVVSTLYDSTGAAIDTYCYNEYPISGGKDYESKESIRANAPLAFQAGDRVVSNSDYEVYIQDNFDFVQNVVVWGAYEQNVDEGNDPWTWIDTNENLVYVSAFTTGETPTQLSESQKVDIVEAITDRKPPLDIMIFKDTVFVYTKINVKAYIENEGYLLPESKTRIENALWDEYNITNYDFEQDIYETEYKAFVQGIDGVHHHYTYFEFYNLDEFDQGDASQDISYTSSTTAIMTPIEEQTIKVYIKDTSSDLSDWILIGTDDGDQNDDGEGTFTGESGYDLTGSSVNYAEGAIDIVESSGITGDYTKWSIKIYYQTSERNLMLQGRNHIFYLKETDVEVEYK
jgi:hypothetical protein